MRKKKNQNEVEEPIMIQILRKHYEDLYEKHKGIIMELTLSDYSADIRERILREFGAEVQELLTLCRNDGSYEAKQIINLCKNMQGTLMCVNAHPEKYEGVPVDNILFEHQADQNDIDGNARENGITHHAGHHEYELEDELSEPESEASEEQEHDCEHEHKYAHEERRQHAREQVVGGMVGEVIRRVSEALTVEDKILIEKAHLDPRDFLTHSAVEKFRASSEYARIAPILEGKSRSRH